MVGSLPGGGWKYRTQAGIDDSRCGVRLDSEASSQACRRSSSPAEFGKANPTFGYFVSGFYREIFHPEQFPGTEAIHPGPLPLNPQQTFTTCIRRSPAERHQDPRPSTIHFAQTTKGIGLGVRKSL